jgi:nucleotide-binding universal stress UspA family protein
MIPPRRILAAIDFSDTSRAALDCAARFARQCQSELHVLHAEHPLLDAAADHAGIDLDSETREELERFIAATPAVDCSPTMHVAAGTAVEVILDHAHRHQADLVVVGGRGMSGTERLVFGSTTEGLLRRSDVSVLVVPTGWEAPRPDALDLTGVGPIVAGVDPSDASMAGVTAACSLASALMTSVEIVHVVPDLAVLARWRGHAEIAVRDRIAAARRELEPLVQRLGCPAPMQLRVEVGAVAEQLAEAASRGAGRAPLIVLGKKRPGSRGGAPGTIAYRVLSTAHSPVLMYVDRDLSSSTGG